MNTTTKKSPVDKAKEQAKNGVIIEAAIVKSRKELTKKLINYGKEKGLSDYAMSKMCGFPQQQWERVVSEEVSFNIYTLMRMAAGLKMKFVFDGTGKNGQILSIDVLPAKK